MLLRVALDTRSHHAAADADRLGLLEAPSVARYRSLLSRIFGFEAPVEAAIAHTPGIDSALLRGRTRIPLLARDLMALGMSAGEIVELPRYGIHSRFPTATRALGWLYVVERSALVHGLMLRHLASQLPATMSGASGYLAAYDGSAGERLRQLGLVLGEVGRGVGAADRIVAGADEAFQAQHRWLSALRARTELQPQRATG
jgi:heme oxygenase